jgi:hypothetical protein
MVKWSRKLFTGIDFGKMIADLQNRLCFLLDIDTCIKGNWRKIRPPKIKEKACGFYEKKSL